jgi:transcriptional regulator with XRE-family HTH domain
MKFGDYLRKCREAISLTQPEAAKKIEIEQSYLSKLETGKSYPSDDIYKRLVDAYNINTQELYELVDSAELEKLKTVREVQDAILRQEKQQVKHVRSWLVAGLALLILGGASLGHALIPSEQAVLYLYRSQAELLPDEPLETFSILSKDYQERPEWADRIARQKALLPRVHQLENTSYQDRGNSFVKKTLNGRRFYEKVSEKEVNRYTGHKWFLIPAFGFLFGALGCFYISRKWRS